MPEHNDPCRSCGCLFPGTDHEALAGNLAAVVVQRDEAESEIRRHHADFGRIRAILDAYDEGSYGSEVSVLMDIRNVVG